MKRKLSVLLASAVIFIPLFITACAPKNTPGSQVNQIPDIPANVGVSLPATQTLSADELSFRIITSPVTNASSWLDYEIANHTPMEFTYGEDFLLLKQRNGAWEYADILPGTGWENFNFILAPYSSNNGSIDIGYFFGELTAGSYRIEKDVFSGDGIFIITTEFEVAGQETAGTKK